MKKLVLIIILTFLPLLAQTVTYINGEVTYKSAEHIYIRFENFDWLEVGDSVFTLKNNQYKVAGTVKFLSSTSCAVEPSIDLNVGSIVYRKYQPKIQPEKIVNKEIDKPIITETSEEIKIQEISAEVEGKESRFYGRIGVTSYSNLTNREKSINTQRWKYRSSLNYENIGGSSLSMTSYVTFSYRTHEWRRVENNLMTALKIYNLAFKYDFNNETNIWFGRRINSNLANISTIDGVQFESKVDYFDYGLVIGSRPHFSDFGYNAKLFEYGGYIARTDSINNKIMKNSFALFQQTNNFKTDRRFLYFQHSNNVIENIDIFFSTEVDLYKREKGEGKSVFDLTSFYFSSRYSPSRFISLTASYDARKNVVYYETYKSVADSILESETRQGLRLSVTVKPINYLMLNFGTGYRYVPGDNEPTKNYDGSITYSRVPFINSSITVSGNYLMTNYLDGKIIGVRIYKDLFDGLLNLGLSYRNLVYNFTSGLSDLKQNIFESNLSVKFSDSIYLNMSYEGAFEETDSFGRIFVNLTKRFR
ncbi:MAG: hypothetical protein M5R37_00450 [Melioribacteraceae bacterium]|nr:hypothetical protein [Melioribacteraceae bacterium]